MTLLDTNVLVRFLQGDPVTVNWLGRIPRGELGIPAIIGYELEYGSLKAAFPARRRSLLRKALDRIEQVPFDSQAALEAARLRVHLEQEGCVIGPMDLLIAGTAVSRNGRLATHNTGEFSRVRGLDVVHIK